jgi:hypothetical protein
VAVGGFDGLTVGGDVAVSPGGRDVGVSEGDGEVGLSVATMGEAVGNGVNAKLGWGVGVLVGTTSATCVLVGVGVTAGAPSRHWTANNPAKLAQTNGIENSRCFNIDNF